MEQSIKWKSYSEQLPSSGTMVLAKTSELAGYTLVKSEWVRHHLSHYKFWAYHPATESIGNENPLINR